MRFKFCWRNPEILFVLSNNLVGKRTLIQMKRTLITMFLSLSLIRPMALFGQDSAKSEESKPKPKVEASTKSKFIGFIDKNNDGINDEFRDADGDGRNDVDHKAYAHKFAFKDKNKDQINDFWVDRDGDGVNDLASKLKGKARREVSQNVLDVNADGRNDITGENYDKVRHRWMGEKWGFWNEQKGKLQGRFIDEDGDGIDDRIKDFGAFVGKGNRGTRMRDRFIDEDGDGICDGRNDFISRMGRCGRGGNPDNRKDSGGHHP